MTVKKILVVDDSPSERVNLEKIVSGAGCMVLTAAGGREALEKAKSKKPDLIFLDIVMPDMDGYATVRALQTDADTKDIPVVVEVSQGADADASDNLKRAA